MARQEDFPLLKFHTERKKTLNTIEGHELSKLACLRRENQNWLGNWLRQAWGNGLSPFIRWKVEPCRTTTWHSSGGIIQGLWLLTLPWTKIRERSSAKQTRIWLPGETRFNTAKKGLIQWMILYINLWQPWNDDTKIEREKNAMCPGLY